jgi:endoglucanase
MRREAASFRRPQQKATGHRSFAHLDGSVKLQLPDLDRRLIATFHYYYPFQFTHQGVEGFKGRGDWKGTMWEGTAEQQEEL